MDRRFAEGLEWARWAVCRWSAFPVDEVPRPVVMVGQRVFVEHEFKTGEAKMAFIERPRPKISAHGLRSAPTIGR
ncbi:MAG TPA: hypothetical protein VGL78_13645 [Solirubrobacteraceae bacterium]